MSKNIEHQYLKLLKDILDNGVEKQDRTGTGTISVFGRQIRHKMSEGFLYLQQRRWHGSQCVTELLWFLRGDTNIKYLLIMVVIFGMVMLIRITYIKLYVTRIL
jgi:thymidylate synthase